MAKIDNWKPELEKRLRKLEHFLDFKNHSFCKNYLGEILEEFFEERRKKHKKAKWSDKNDQD